MILDKLCIQPDISIDRDAFAAHYQAYPDYWKKAFDFLDHNDLDKNDLGKYDLGNGVCATISEYAPKDIKNACFEAHRKYIDIHYVVSGKELIGLTDIENATVVEAYKEDGDTELEAATEFTLLTATPENFFIFFPKDAHCPGIKDKEVKVRKVVIKVPV